jgi:hypothetical protein
MEGLMGREFYGGRVDSGCNLVGFGNGRDNVHMDLAG